LSFPAPLWKGIRGNAGGQAFFLPNMGFTINVPTTQTSATESTQYNFNFPIELSGQLGSYDSANALKNAVFYADIKGGFEHVSSGLQSSIGLSSGSFWLLQMSAGITFQQQLQIGFQYYVGPKGLYNVVSTTGTGTTPVTSSLGGFHLVVSYNRPTTAN
jgi:hypothetical protein